MVKNYKMWAGLGFVNTNIISHIMTTACFVLRNFIFVKKKIRKNLKCIVNNDLKCISSRTYYNP